MSTPFRYEERGSPAQKLHPLAKAAALLILSALSMRPHPISMALSAAAAIVTAGLARIGFKEFLRDARFLLWMAFFIIPARLIDPWRAEWFMPENLPGALAYLARIALVFVHAEVFYKSTSAWSLADAVTGLYRGATGKKAADPGLYVALAVSFMPRALEASAGRLEAARVRGLGTKGFRIRAFSSLIAAMVKGSIDDAFLRIEALEARSYSSARSLPGKPPSGADAAFALVPAAILAATAILGV